MKVVIYYKEKGSLWIGSVWDDFKTKEEAMNKWLAGIKNPTEIEIVKTEIVEVWFN